MRRDAMKRKMLIVAVLFIFGVLPVKSWSSPSEAKFKNDSPIAGWIIEFGADYLVIFSPVSPFIIALGGIANIRSYELPLLAAVAGKKAVGIRTAVVILPSGEKERRIMQMRFLSKLK